MENDTRRGKANIVPPPRLGASIAGMKVVVVVVESARQGGFRTARSPIDLVSPPRDARRKRERVPKTSLRGLVLLKRETPPPPPPPPSRDDRPKFNRAADRLAKHIILRNVEWGLPPSFAKVHVGYENGPFFFISNKVPVLSILRGNRSPAKRMAVAEERHGEKKISPLSKWKNVARECCGTHPCNIFDDDAIFYHFFVYEIGW